MFRKAVAPLLALAIMASSAVAMATQMFGSERDAQAHCPKDEVVWLNTKTGVFHYKGQRWYGATKNGAFVCKDEALRGGERATRNGQR